MFDEFLPMRAAGCNILQMQQMIFDLACDKEPILSEIFKVVYQTISLFELVDALLISL